MDEEARSIRDEVVCALAEQGEDVEALGYAPPDLIEGERGEVALPQWEGVPAALAALGAPTGRAGRAEGGFALPPSAAFASGAASLGEADVERLFLAAVFDDVRAQSAAAQLVLPSSWADRGLVPAHQSPEEWEMFVYEFLEQGKAGRAARHAEAAPASPARSAARPVGVPPAFRCEDEAGAPPAGAAFASGAAEPAGAASFDADADSASSAEQPVSAAPERPPAAAAPAPASSIPPAAAPPPASSIPASDEAKPADGRDPSVETEGADEAGLPPCDDIVSVVGRRSYYLYSSRFMTDAYARWAFLAREDDRTLAFVECVRGESRTYPRPMEAASLMNAPFCMSPEDISELWRAVHESGAYPDLETLVASNGERYFFSSDCLSAAYAASLAEWNSVEREQYR